MMSVDGIDAGSAAGRAADQIEDAAPTMMDLAKRDGASKEIRLVAFRMLGSAHDERNKSEWRLWAARDEVRRLRLLFLDAQAAEAIAQRDFDRAQELLQSIWADAKP